MTRRWRLNKTTPVTMEENKAKQKSEEERVVTRKSNLFVFTTISRQSVATMCNDDDDDMM